MGKEEAKKIVEQMTANLSPEGIREIKPTCEKCGGVGYIVSDDGAKPCECQDKAKTKANLRHARIPKRFMEKSFSNYKGHNNILTDIQGWANKWLLKHESESNGLFLYGGVGTGKTHLAVSMLKELIQEGYSGVYYNVVDLLKDIRSTFSQETALTEFDLLSQTCGVDVLVLDDLGAEKTTDWVLDKIYHIINKRYEEELTTIITSNYGFDELRARVGMRITSRIKEMCHIIHFPFEDYREKLLKDSMK